MAAATGGSGGASGTGTPHGDGSRGDGGRGTGSGGGDGSGRGPGKGSGSGSGTGSGHGSGSGAGTGPGLIGFSKPDYPGDARRQGAEGRVVVRYRVSASGSLLDASVASSSGNASLDNAAVQGVRRARFAPARRGGEAVEGSGKVAVVFRLSDA